MKYTTYKRDLKVYIQHHLPKKLKSRNNIKKVTYSGPQLQLWYTKHLLYSITEYYAPVWVRSAHYNKKFDVQLNHTMRIISGTVKSTQPVLANIAPLTFKIFLIPQTSYENKTFFNTSPKNIMDHPPARLRSKHLTWLTEVIADPRDHLWKERWNLAVIC